MKAAYLQNHHIHVGDVPDPVPVKGQALVRTHSCGLCASDAHFVQLGSKVVEMSQKYGGPYSNLDLSRIIVPGSDWPTSMRRCTRWPAPRRRCARSSIRDGREATLKIAEPRRAGIRLMSVTMTGRWRPRSPSRKSRAPTRSRRVSA